MALPPADLVVLVRDGVTLGYAEWGGVVQALPNALDPLPTYPPRFLAADFPEEWQLGALDLKTWHVGPG